MARSRTKAERIAASMRQFRKSEVYFILLALGRSAIERKQLDRQAEQAKAD